MATIQRFDTCKIAIYADDHHPPHFHIEGRGWRALVVIATLEVQAGDARRGGEALEWAQANRALLQAEWDRLNTRS